MIQVQNVSKTYISGRGRLAALCDVSFSVKTGQAIVVVGKSGSGKTTLLNCMAGFEKPDRGWVTCMGTHIQSLAPKARKMFQRRDLGVVFQFGNLLSYLTVFENIAFPLALNGMAGGQIKARVLDLLEKVDLAGAAAALPHELSGGEIQRVGIARAIAHRPKIFLADEPTASLDSATGRDLVDLIFSMGRAQGCTMIIATHDPEIVALADATVQLRDGKVVGAYERFSG